MRTRLQNSLTADEKKLLAAYVERNKDATEKQKERYILDLRARHRAAARDKKRGHVKNLRLRPKNIWSRVANRDIARLGVERFDDEEGRAYCGPRYAHAQSVWARESEVFTGLMATTRTRCDLDGSFLEEECRWDALDAAVGTDMMDELDELFVYDYGSAREAFVALNDAAIDYLEWLGVDVDDPRDDMHTLIDLIELGEQEPWDMQHRCGVEYDDDDTGTTAWRLRKHGPLQGSEAYEQWLDQVLWQEEFHGVMCDVTRRQNIERRDPPTTVDFDCWFWNKLDDLNFRARKMIKRGRDDWRELSMPEVHEVRKPGKSGKRASLQDAMDYYDSKPRPTDNISIDEDHEFEEVDGDVEWVEVEPVEAQPRNGKVNGHAMQAKTTPEPIVAPVPADPDFEPEFDEDDDGDGSTRMTTVLAASP